MFVRLINSMLNRYIILILFLFSSLDNFAQKITIDGTVTESFSGTKLPYAVIMAIHLNDSVLVSFTRSNNEGVFRIENLPLDTYQVIISHPQSGDQSIIILGDSANTDIHLGNISLPGKSVSLREVTIHGYSDAVYYKGDTLVYTADSFKVKQNAVVEDLLKKLPGIKVDAQGKIFSEGKAIDQLLVDGDEFFGSDPTIATKNLNARSVESVEVYEKKNDGKTENSDSETLKIMNLKLKLRNS